jgi:hypothetical protein
LFILEWTIMGEVMKNLHVWVDYQPRLYEDLILRVLQLVDQKEAGVSLTLHAGKLEEHPGDLPLIDVIVHSTDQMISSPGIPECASQATWIAFSPKGHQGWMRPNPQCAWELIRPFGIDQLLRELLWRAKQTQEPVLS